MKVTNIIKLLFMMHDASSFSKIENLNVNLN